MGSLSLLPFTFYANKSSADRLMTDADTECAMWWVMQERVGENREQKRSQLDERHDYILTIVADHLGLELSHVEDAVLEGSQVKQNCCRYLCRIRGC